MTRVSAGSFLRVQPNESGRDMTVTVTVVVVALLLRVKGATPRFG